MEIRIKLGLSILMGLGLFAAGSAVATAYELHVVQNTTDPTCEAPRAFTQPITY